MRNKIDLDELLNKKLTMTNIVHMINVCAALINEKNESQTLKFLNNIRNNNDIIIYKLIFLFYNYKNKTAYNNLLMRMIEVGKNYDFLFLLGLIKENGIAYIKKFDNKAFNLGISIKNDEYETGKKFTNDNDLIYMFKHKLNLDNKISVFQAVRMFFKTKYVIEDKSGISKYLYKKMEDNATFILNLLIECDEIESCNLDYLKNLIQKNKDVDFIAVLVTKHKNIINYDKIVKLLMEKDFVDKPVFMAKNMTKDEIIRYVTNNIIDMKFICNLNNVNLFSLLEKRQFKTLVQNKELLKVLVNLTDFNNVKNKNFDYYKDITFCSLYKKYLDNNFVLKIIKFVDVMDFTVDFDYLSLNNDFIIKTLLYEYLAKEEKKILILIKLILGKIEYEISVNLEKYIKICDKLFDVKEFKDIKYLYDV